MWLWQRSGNFPRQSDSRTDIGQTDRRMKVVPDGGHYHKGYSCKSDLDASRAVLYLSTLEGRRAPS